MTDLSVPNYSIHKKIGEGAMSEVFLGFDSDGKSVALKILRQFLKNDQACIERIRKEADNLEKLEDDRIIKLVDVLKSDDDRLVLVQEYVDGPNLEELLSRCELKTMPGLGATLISEVLLGLEEAHRQEIVHRDLKPENIMINSKGRVKIADFGVAKNLESEELTVTGMIIGSPAFMSPEQVSNETIDQRSDIFSLGVILYKMATGELPFVGNNFAALIKSINEGEYRPCDRVNPGIHPELARIIHKALERDRTVRYQKVYQFRYELMSYLDSLGIGGPQKILRRFLEGDLSIESEMGASLMNTIIVRAKDALKKGHQSKSIRLVQQALSIEPDNSEAQELLTTIGRRQRSYKPIWLGGIAAVAVVIAFIFGSNFNSEPLASKPEVVIKKVEVVPTIASVKKTPEKIAKKKAKKKPIKKIAKAETNFLFKVDKDVQVFLDGRLIRNAHNRKVRVTPGKHQVMLVKEGYDPIRSYIEAPEGKTSTINVPSK